MLTPTSKLFLPVAWTSLFLGAVYKILTGDLLGSVLFLMVGVLAFLIGVMLSTVRENEYVPVYGPDAPPPTVRAVAVAPRPGGGGWPVAGGVSLALVMLGLIEHPLFTWAGVLLAIVAGAGWLARAASETTGRQVSLAPIGLPFLGLCTIASVMFFMSRILLTVPEEASTAIALFVAVLILGGASIAAVRPNISSRTLTVALVLGSTLMVAGGLVAADRGERTFEEHSAEHAGAVDVTASGVAFKTTTITLKAGADAEIVFDNTDAATQHNIVIFASDPAKPVFRGALVTGPAKTTYTFKAPAAGEYKFQCDVHPTQMKGIVKVV